MELAARRLIISLKSLTEVSIDYYLIAGEYLTFKQIQDLNGKIKKGAKSHVVVFYKKLGFEDEATDEIVIKTLLRYYRVFSLYRC